MAVDKYLTSGLPICPFLRFHYLGNHGSPDKLQRSGTGYQVVTSIATSKMVDHRQLKEVVVLGAGE